MENIEIEYQGVSFVIVLFWLTDIKMGYFVIELKKGHSSFFAGFISFEGFLNRQNWSLFFFNDWNSYFELR